MHSISERAGLLVVPLSGLVPAGQHRGSGLINFWRVFAGGWRTDSRPQPLANQVLVASATGNRP